MRRGVARRHRHSARAQAACGNGSAGDPGPPVSCLADTGALRASRNPNDVIEEETTLGESIADGVAQFGGSWTFIILVGIVLAIYTSTNVGLGKNAWDPYPFILLNLFLSMIAAIQAPVIMMSQNRQDTKDRLRGELDFEVNRRAESEIQNLSRKLSLLDDKIDDIGKLLRPVR